MSNNSWKQYGGISKLDKFQHLTIGTLVADQVLLREKVSTVTKFNTTIEVNPGDVNVVIGNVNAQNFNSSNNLTVTNISYLKGKIYIGTNNYLNPSINGIGINNDNPLATLDIYGNLIVRSGTTNIRNIIAQNINNKGVVVSVDNNNSYIDFFNTTNTSNINAPNSRITTNDSTFKLDTSNIIMNSITTKINTLSTIDICSNNIGNITAGSTINLLSYSNININANTLLNIISPSSTIYSRLHIKNRNVSSNNIFDETIVIYDIASGKYLYDVYENNNYTTGHALTLVSNNASSNTFMKIVSPNQSGLGIGGGTYNNDNSRSFGIIGLSKSDGNNGNIFIPIQNIVSGNTKAKYYATIGINKHSPLTEKYVMDINGATRITNGEINKVQDVSFQIINTSFSKTNKLFGIAVGTPSSIISPYVQNIYYTNDGGLNWNLSRISSTAGALESTNKNLFLNVYDKDFSIIGTDSTYLFYSKNGGADWIQISTKSDFTIETIKSIYVARNQGSSNRIFLTFYNVLGTSIETSFGYFDYNSNVDKIISKKDDFKPISGLNYIPSIKYVDGSSNYIYYVGNGIQRYDISNNIIDKETNTDTSYNHINVLDNSYAIAVGNNIISYTKDGGLNWNNKQFNNISFNSVYVYDEKRAITVGNNGVFYYTNNGYSNWNAVPDVLLNSGGNGNILNGSNINLRNVHMPNINSFVISRNIQSYILDSNNNQLGLSKIYYCYLPNLFNRSQNNVLDISGSIQIGGDLNINEGGNLYVNQDSILNGNLFVNYDVSLNSRLNVGSDAIINNRLFTIGDVSLSGSLYVSKDTTIIGNLNVTNRIINNSDVVMKSSLFVDYDASISGNINIGKDLTVNGNLIVKQYQNQNIINTTVNRYTLIVSEDLSLNGRLYTSSDVSLNGNLYVNKNMLINTTNNITNALVNINGNMITNYIGINTTNINTNLALDINGNVFHSNGCIFQF